MKPFGIELGNMAKTFGNIHALSALFKNHFTIDSGATDYMCSSSHMLFDIASSALYPLITVANRVQAPTQSVGQLRIFSKNLDALLVPNLSLNLIL